MQSNFKNIMFIMGAVTLLIFGNKETYTHLIREWDQRNFTKAQREIDPLADKTFESQKLVFKEHTSTFTNESHYFGNTRINRFNYTLKKQLKN